MIRKQLIRLLVATLAVAVPLVAVLAFSVSGTGVAQAAPAVFNPAVVDDGGDGSGPCVEGSNTLRCAITYANAHTFTNVRFAPGLPAVLLQTALPTITGEGTWIDGHDLSNGCVCPRIDASLAGSWTGDNGLTISANAVTISNMKIVNIPSGADISIMGGKNNEISHDYLGILPNATQCGGTQATVGVEVANDRAGSGSPSNGTAYIFANTISCHGGSGVEVVNSNYVYVGTQRDNNTSPGNNIGTTANGVGAAGNGYAGVRIAVNSDQVKVTNNQIAYNASGGVIIQDGSNMSVINNRLSANYWGLAISGGITESIEFNKIGTSPDGTSPMPNTHEGIIIYGGSGLYLSANLVAYNGAAGIAVTGNSTHASIGNNEIRNNGGLPIDLGNDGATLNGSRSLPGPNNWLPYPTGTFNGTGFFGNACPNCIVYIFKAIGNPAGPGGGGIVQAIGQADGSGNWQRTTPAGLTGLNASFTATDAGGNTSEMSPQKIYLYLPLIRR